MFPCLAFLFFKMYDIEAQCVIKFTVNWCASLQDHRALAVVKVTLQVNGNSQFLGVLPPKKNFGAIKIKSGTNNYVGEGNPHAKFGNIEITGGSPYRWNITFRTLPITFFNVMPIFEQGYRWDRVWGIELPHLKTIKNKTQCKSGKVTFVSVT